MMREVFSSLLRPHQRHLRLLNLSGNAIHGECLELLLSLLRQHAKLERLLLADCKLWGADCLRVLDVAHKHASMAR
eukprot:725469-Hanusia_phi.AAC.2